MKMITEQLCGGTEVKENYVNSLHCLLKIQLVVNVQVIVCSCLVCEFFWERKIGAEI
jgi:dimeric dUTPase (all-alpha-NTP-PPase superfamily)